MNNFRQRVLTGSSLAIVILAAVYFGSYSFTLLLLLIGLFSLQEFYRLLEMPGARPFRAAGLIIAAGLLLGCVLVLSGLTSWKWMLLSLPAAFGVFAAALYQPLKRPFLGLSITFLGVMIIGLPLCCFASLPFFGGEGHYRFELPMGYFLLLWTNDTAAYLTGRTLGKHWLFQRISPKKTWEGSLGGALSALTVAYLLSRCFTVLSALEWETLAGIIIVTGTYGDLFKSLLKRCAEVKDSGTILPGHGGMLDRFDSLLGSAPFAFAYLILIWK